MSRVTLAAALGLLACSVQAVEMDYFYKNYEEAEKIARQQGKPLYLHFTTTWCGWCRRIENDVYKVEEGKKALSPFVCATLDCTVPRGQQPSGSARFNRDLMKKYGGGGYPFLLMVTPEGDLLHTIGGYKPLAAFKEDLAKAQENLKKLKDFKAYAAKADKTSYEYNARALTFYSDVGMWPKAAVAARAIQKLDPEFKKGQAALVNYALLRSTVPQPGEEDKFKALEEAVIRHDGENAHGYLEKVLLARASAAYRKAARARNKEGFARAADALNLLLKKAKKVTNEANVRGFLGFVQMQAGNREAAIAAMEKALELEPTGRRSDMLKRYLKTLKEQRDKDAQSAKEKTGQ